MENKGNKNINICKIFKCYTYLLKIFILVVFFSYNLILGQEGKEKKIISKEYSNFDSIKVLEDSTYFDGYLIFKIDKNPDTLIYKTDNEFYSCDIFWLKYLNYINIDTSFYYYNFYTLLYYQYIVNNDYLKNNSLEYLRFKNYFEKYSPTLNDAAYYLKHFFKTNIFNNVKLWNYGSKKNVGYFIYKISLYGSILSASFSIYSKKNDEEPNIEKFLVPLSNFYVFKEVTDIELQNLGFKKSKWYPKNLFGK